MPTLITFIRQALHEQAKHKRPKDLPNKIDITNFAQAKYIVKPWGYELWMADGKRTPYAFKILFLKKGTKTSLQYHLKKTEHNCVLIGKIRFHYQNKKTRKVVTKVIAAGCVIAVRPPAVHRIEALTDVLLVEASSSELDDVVRLHDDYQRPDGKITSEHQARQKRGTHQKR